MDLEAERERIRREIEELERNLRPPQRGSPAPPDHPHPHQEEEEEEEEEESEREEEEEGSFEDSDGSDAQDEMGGGGGGEGGALGLPRTPSTCLQMNLVYQEVLQEKLEDVHRLLAQNKEQQEKLTWELSGRPGAAKPGSGKSWPSHLFLGHFLKPYFKDAASGVGPPANGDSREKAKQGIKAFEELLTVKWKSREKQLLREAVLSDRLQRLLQPKLLNLGYLNEKLAKSRDETERRILEKQIREKEGEIEEINLLPEEALLANRFEEHDWEKIANVNFEGTRSGTELRRFWQNAEHPDINRKEWGPTETEVLKEAARRHNAHDWAAIARELGTQRTAFQCLQQFQAYNAEFKRREWAPDEDRMLREMVQEMRVGRHIPYRKIAYYMEGRDPAQLIYRWTKRLDPKLKHGAWSPREDALLLKAVAKFGERDWYKIRAEVPGRSDLQCRDRYLHSLHVDIKKGKWSEEEERKLVELTEKYGVGHWAKIASELPHRSGTQCLSKWKVLLGYRRGLRRRSGAPPRKRHPPSRKRRPRGSPSPPETSSEGSDLETDTSSEGESQKEGEGEKEEREKEERERPLWRVPGLDLWVPTRRAAEGTLPLPSSSSPSAMTRSEGPQRKEAQGGRARQDSWGVSLAFVRSVLRRNSFELHRRNREVQRKKRFATSSSSPPGAPPGRQPLTPGGRGGTWRHSLHRRLMLAVAPWAEGPLQERRLRARRDMATLSKAEFISRGLESARQPSTPLFALFIQLLRIDVDGCMKVIQTRKSRPSENLKSLVGNNTRDGQASSDPTAQAPGPALAQRKLLPLPAKGAPTAPPSSSSSRDALLSRPAAKRKTVSELLREKRLREAQARKAQQQQRSRALLAPQILVAGAPGLQIPAPNLQIPVAAERPTPSLQISAPNLQIPTAECPNRGPHLPLPLNNVQGAAAPSSSPDPSPGCSVALTWVLTPQGLLPLLRLPSGQGGDPAVTLNPNGTPVVSREEAAAAASSQPRHPPRILGDPDPPKALDYRLLSNEDTSSWERRSQGGLGTRLPYLPPFLCSLRTLSALLRLKETLSRQAASLCAPGASGEMGLRALVRGRLEGNPAYGALRGRFLAAFAFPAALAALAPFRVPTTLSGAEPDQDSSWEGEGEGGGEEEAAAPHQAAAGGPGEEADSDGHGGPPETQQESGAECSNPELFGIRRSSRLRKRRKRH